MLLRVHAGSSFSYLRAKGNSFAPENESAHEFLAAWWVVKHHFPVYSLLPIRKSNIPAGMHRPQILFRATLCPGIRTLTKIPF